MCEFPLIKSQKEDECVDTIIGIPNCFKYQDEETCLTCDDKTYLIENTCEEVDYTEEEIQNFNCQIWSDDTICWKCKSGFVINEENTTCLELPAGCMDNNVRVFQGLIYCLKCN